MNRRDFLKNSGAGFAVLSFPKLWPFKAESDNQTACTKPNIIFILTDDVGLGDISCCGGTNFKTPNIDKLAETGTRFEYAFSPPICGPTRCQVLTGRYPFRTGLITNRSADAIHPSREVMMPTVLKKAGYITAHCGKWGQMSLGPGEWGFDQYLVYENSGIYWRSQTPSYIQNGKTMDFPEDKYMPDLMHDFVVDFITANKDKPFYVHYSMSQMHSKIMRTPDSKEGAGKDEFYADNIAYMDKLVGKLTDELDRLKLREKTLIIFTGDNGTSATVNAPVNGKPLSGCKGTMREGGSREPLIVNWQGTTPAGKVNHDLTDFSDFFVTFADLAGAKLPEGVVLDGQSFAPQIRGLTGKPREWVYVEHNGRSYVRNARWKLTNNGEFFDMKEAPFNEIPVPESTTDNEAIAGRKRLKEILDKLPTAPSIDSGEKKKKPDNKPGKKAKNKVVSENEQT